MAALQNMPVNLLLEHVEDCKIHQLIKHAASIQDVKDTIAPWHQVGGIEFNHSWEAKSKSFVLKLDIIYPMLGREEEEDEAQDTVTFEFNDTKFEAIKMKLEELQNGIPIDEDHLKVGAVIYMKRNWENIASISSFLINTFTGPLEVAIKANVADRVSLMLRNLPLKQSFSIILMGFNQMTEDDANMVLQSVSRVDMFIFDKYKSTFDTFSASNFTTVMFDQCPFVSLNDIVVLENPKIHLVDSDIESEDLACFAVKWFNRELPKFEKLCLEYHDDTKNPIVFQNIIDYNPNFTRKKEKARRKFMRKTDFTIPDEYRRVWSSTEAIDIFRPDGSFGTIARVRNSTYFVVWHNASAH
ncbi:unnamed protein product [Caenorhabditis brenneri]